MSDLILTRTSIDISNLPAYYPGELWHSYLNRVAIANGFSSATEMFAVITDSPAKWKNQYLNYDCSKPVARTILKSTGEDWILSGTTFKGMAPLMDRLNGTRRISLYNINSSMNSRLAIPMPAFTQELCICPECRRIEGKAWYFHTDLQMPNVKICPKHGCALNVYTGTPFMEHYEDSFAPLEPTPIDESLSPFEVDFFNAGLDCDISGILKYITDKAYSLGIGRFSSREEASWPDAGLFENFLPSPSTIREANPNRMPPDLIFPLLAYLSGGDVEDILQHTEATGKDIALETAISKEYKIASPLRRDFLLVECLDCGTTFPTTPTALKMGWECPVCNDITDETEQFARMVSIHSKGRHVHAGVFCGWNAPFSYVQKDGGEKKTVLPEDYFAKDFTFTEFDNYAKEVAALGPFRLDSYRIVNRQPRFTIVHKGCEKAFESFRTNFLVSPKCRICEPKPTAEQTFLTKLSQLSKDFHVIGTYSKDHVEISDGSMSFEGKPTTVFSRLSRHLSPTKKVSHDKEYRLIDRRLSELKGTIISLDDLAEITDKRTVSNYINRLSSNGKLKRLAIGLTCHPDEDYTIVDIQKKHILGNGNDGCAICDSALIQFGETVANPRHAFAINFGRDGDNHCFIGGKSYGNPSVFLLQIHANKENIHEMTFVASVWHREMLSSPDKDESLLTILKHCIQSGASTDKILELGDMFPMETGLEVRRLIRRFNEQSK